MTKRFTYQSDTTVAYCMRMNRREYLFYDLIHCTPVLFHYSHMCLDLLE